MAQHPEVAIQRVLAFQERKNRHPARSELGHGDIQPDIPASVLHSGDQGLPGVFLASRDHVDFRQVQIELRLIPFHAHGGVAQAFRVSPFLLRAGKRNAKVRHVIGIILFKIGSALDVRQGAVGKIVAEIRQPGLELAESFRVHHLPTSQLSRTEPPGSKTVLGGSSRKSWQTPHTIERKIRTLPPELCISRSQVRYGLRKWESTALWDSLWSRSDSSRESARERGAGKWNAAGCARKPQSSTYIDNLGTESAAVSERHTIPGNGPPLLRLHRDDGRWRSPG